MRGYGARRMIPPIKPSSHATDRALPQFEPTHWSLVARAGSASETQRRAALGALYGAYWFPLYAFLRQSGRAAHDAEDLVQALFLRLADGRLFASADRGRGRFRTLLLAALKNLDVDVARAARAERRGGGAEVLSLGWLGAEARWEAVAAEADPAAAFDRAWAAALLDRAAGRIHVEYREHGREGLFRELFARLTGVAAEGLEAVGERHGVSEAAVKMAVLRLRRRYAEIVREEIAATTDSPAEAREELRYLLAIFP